MRMNPNLSAVEATATSTGAATKCSIDYTFTSPNEFAAIAFDYIIIGGGTAGLTVATHLAASGAIVGVIEAGIARPDDPLIDTPGYYGQAMNQPGYDWSYFTTPQPHLNDNTVGCSAGKVLGGSSAINFLVSMRASAPEYDAWAKLGSPSWDWNGLLPFFKETEQYVGPAWGTDQIFPGITKKQDEEARRLEPKFKGYKGPIHHNHNEIYTDALRPFIEAVNTLEITTNRSPDYGDNTGIFNIGTAVDRSTGKRSYAASVYSEPSKLNVVVLTDSQATRIILEKSDNGLVTATGVEYFYLRQPRTAYAKKEIILSAGAYNSPKLLELSGIGNSRILEPLGIQTVIDLPGVGENLQDHLYVPSDFVAKDGVFTFDALRTDPTYEAEQRQLYDTTGTGAYATTVSAYGYFKLDKILSAAEIRQMREDLDREIAESAPTPLQTAQYELQKEYLDQKEVGELEIIMVPHVFATVPPAEGVNYVGVVAAITHPFSRGTVHISKNDPLVPPTIDPNHLGFGFDARCLVEATKFMRKVSETAPLKDILKAPSTPPASTITYAHFDSYVRGNAVSLQHPIGTVAMAPQELGGVVDDNLLVYGTTNLRVADMSVAPLHIATHTCDTAYAIGNKAYNLIAASQRKRNA